MCLISDFQVSNEQKDRLSKRAKNGKVVLWKVIKKNRKPPFLFNCHPRLRYTVGKVVKRDRVSTFSRSNQLVRENFSAKEFLAAFGLYCNFSITHGIHVYNTRFKARIDLDPDERVTKVECDLKDFVAANYYHSVWKKVRVLT